MRLVMVALDGRLLDGAVHPFDLAVRPRVTRLGEAVLDIEGGDDRTPSVRMIVSCQHPNISSPRRRSAALATSATARWGVDAFRISLVNY